MNISRISAIVSFIVFVLTILSFIKINEYEIILVKNIVEKENVINAVKSGASDVQDDFRRGRNDIIKKHAEKKLFNALYEAGRADIGAEKKEISSLVSNKIEGEKIEGLKRNHLDNIRRIRGKIYSCAKNTERIYFYAYKGKYHRLKCIELLNITDKTELFSSMEAAALSGYYPCEKCILDGNGA